MHHVNVTAMYYSFFARGLARPVPHNRLLRSPARPWHHAGLHQMTLYRGGLGPAMVRVWVVPRVANKSAADLCQGSWAKVSAVFPERGGDGGSIYVHGRPPFATWGPELAAGSAGRTCCWLVGLQGDVVKLTEPQCIGSPVLAL